MNSNSASKLKTREIDLVWSVVRGATYYISERVFSESMKKADMYDIKYKAR